MKNQNFVSLMISGVVGLALLGAGCSTKPTRPAPAAAETKADTPVPTPPPAPPAETEKNMKLTSGTGKSFALSGDYNLTSENRFSPFNHYAGHNRGAHTTHAIFLNSGGEAVGVVKLPSFEAGKELDIDALPGALFAPGWTVAARVRSLVLEPEFGDKTPTRTLTVHADPKALGESTEKTIKALSEGTGLWVVVQPGTAIPDFGGMAIDTAYTAALVAAIKNDPGFADELAAVKNPNHEWASTGWNLIHMAGKYRSIDRAFQALPEEAQVRIVKSAGPIVIRQGIELVGTEIIRKYLADLSWEKVLVAPPDNTANWPHHDPGASIAQFGGLSKNQDNDIGHALRFWGRRGEAVFKAVKAIALTELARTPAPAATPKPAR